MDVDSRFGLFANWSMYDIPELKISSSFCSSSHALPPVIFENVSRTCLSTISNASKNVCRLSRSTSSMNLTMELRSPSSMFLRIDMERYPVEISMYVAGAVAFSAPSVCSSASSPRNSGSGSKLGSYVILPEYEPSVFFRASMRADISAISRSSPSERRIAFVFESANPLSFLRISCVR